MYFESKAFEKKNEQVSIVSPLRIFSCATPQWMNWWLPRRVAGLLFCTWPKLQSYVSWGDSISCEHTLGSAAAVHFGGWHSSCSTSNLVRSKHLCVCPFLCRGKAFDIQCLVREGFLLQDGRCKLSWTVDDTTHWKWVKTTVALRSRWLGLAVKNSEIKNCSNKDLCHIPTIFATWLWPWTHSMFADTLRVVRAEMRYAQQTSCCVHRTRVAKSTRRLFRTTTAWRSIVNPCHTWSISDLTLHNWASSDFDMFVFDSSLLQIWEVMISSSNRRLRAGKWVREYKSSSGTTVWRQNPN